MGEQVSCTSEPWTPLPPLPPQLTTATWLRTRRPRDRQGRLLGCPSVSPPCPSLDPCPEEPSSEPTLTVEAWPWAGDSRSFCRSLRSIPQALPWSPKALASCRGQGVWPSAERTLSRYEAARGGGRPRQAQAARGGFQGCLGHLWPPRPPLPRPPAFLCSSHAGLHQALGLRTCWLIILSDRKSVV